MTPPTAEERESIRAQHVKYRAGGSWLCPLCLAAWPCDAARLLDALEATEAERDTLIRSVQSSEALAGIDISYGELSASLAKIEAEEASGAE